MRISSLTPEQRAIMLRLCNAAEHGRAIKLVTETGVTKPKRETSTGCALVRKGLARRLADGRFEATDEGFWLGDALRIAARLADEKG